MNVRHSESWQERDNAHSPPRPLSQKKAKQRNVCRRVGRFRVNLDGSPVVWRATSFIRDTKSGRLDAIRISRLYAVPLRKIASLLGVKTSDLRRAPHRNEYQSGLSRFEQTARVIPMLRDESEFATWAKTANAELGAAPLDLLWVEHGARQVVELVDELLTGQPD